MRPFLLTLLGAMTIPLPALALPPGGTERGFVDGANHHLGDASFVALYGRAPTADDGEKERMHAHLAFVHDWLLARPATRPMVAFMTLPMSWGDVAPVSSTASATSARSSSSESSAGR